MSKPADIQSVIDQALDPLNYIDLRDGKPVVDKQETSRERLFYPGYNAGYTNHCAARIAAIARESCESIVGLPACAGGAAPPLSW